MPEIHAQTMILVGLFAAVYLAVLVRKTLRHDLDLYDLFMLSAVAVIPVLFAYFPSAAYGLAALAGVAFPFVVMFGILIAVLFLFIHRLTVSVQRLSTNNRLLVQELALVRLQLDSLSKEAR